MYHWTTLRTVAGVLLCIPLIHVAFILSKDIGSYMDPSPEVWNRDIADLIEDDLGTTLPENPVVVIGGHRVRLWTDLPATIAPRETLLRPLGDATLEDLSHHYNRLAGFYRPDILVVFPGYADLHLRDEKTPRDFEESARALLEMDEEYGSSQWRYMIAPVQMPLHPKDQPRIAKINDRLKALSQELPDLTVIDPNPFLSRVDGSPNPEFYRGDGINLSPAGYARISLLLSTELKSREQEAARLSAAD